MNQLHEEIWQQPEALAAVRKFYTSPGAISAKALEEFGSPSTVIFTGMGASLDAAYPAQAFLTSRGIRALVWEAAELLHHHLRVLERNTLLVAVSRSGETIEITELIEQLDEGSPLVAVTNVERSTLARRARLMLPLMAKSQCPVATKTYMNSVAVLMYLAHAIVHEPHNAVTEALTSAMDAQERIFDRQETTLPPTLEFFNQPAYVALLSRGPDLATAHEGALMLKEVARVAAEPMSAAQFRHGPIEILNAGHRYVIFARAKEPGSQPAARTEKLLLHLANDIATRGGKVLLISDTTPEELLNIHLLPVEPIHLGLGTLVDTLHIQLLAYDLALRAGIEPGTFWIAQGVTRQE